MLEIQKLGPFKEMTPTLDYIHIENKFGPHGEGANAGCQHFVR